MAIYSSWIKSALFLIIWLFSPLVKGESEGGLHISENTKLFFVVAGSIILFLILFLLLFCFCRKLIFACIENGPSLYDYICINNCKKSTAPDNGRIEAHMDDQRTKIKGMKLQAMEHHEIDPEIVNALEEYLHDIFQDSHHNSCVHLLYYFFYFEEIINIILQISVK